MDMRTGKLSDEDYQAIDGALRSEAVQILERLDDALAHEDAVRAAEAAGDEPVPQQTGADSADEQLGSAR
jgi:hypothetical protein